MTSVLQDWVMDLPLREQGTILAGLRGCDLTPKRPLILPERQLIAYLRWCTMIPADPREVGVEGAYMQDYPPRSFNPSDLGHYPQHFYAHLMHAFEVVAYRAPAHTIQANAEMIYLRMVENLHLVPESRIAMIRRLSEDRIASGKVVS